MNSFSGWKRLVNIVDSPSNGMTYECGVSNELGEDPLEVLKYPRRPGPYQPRSLPQ